MYRIQTDDGQSSRIDLKNEKQACEWLTRLKDPAFQKSIRTVGILQQCGGKWRCPTCNRSRRLVCSNCKGDNPRAVCNKTIQFVSSRPEGFDQIFYYIEHLSKDMAEKMHGGQRITCFVDDVRLTITTHTDQPAVRVSLLKTGKQRYNPLAE